jgi:hypothetical protein
MNRSDASRRDHSLVDRVLSPGLPADEHAPAPPAVNRGTTSGVPPASDGSGLRPYWLVAAPILAIHALVVWLGRAPGITTRQDDAVYLMLERALRTGHGYVELFTPGHPAHAQYPPGYPAVLAAVGAVAGERIGLFLALNIAFSVAALALFYVVAARRWRPAIALAALGLAAINPLSTFIAGNVLSEPLFTLLTFATLALALRERQSNWSLLLVGALALAAAFTRSAGFALVIAIGLAWLLERRWAPAACLALVGGALCGAWLYHAAQAPVLVPGRSYVADALVGIGRSRSGVVAALASRVISNGRTYLTELVPWALPAPTIRGTWIDNAACVALLLACGGAGLVEVWRRARAVVVFLACYGALLLAWTWPVDRFLVPVVPLLLLVVLAGAFKLVGRVSDWPRLVLPSFIVVAIAFAAVERQATFLRRAQACDRDHATTAEACYNADQRAFFEAARVTARSSPPSAVVASQKPATFYYYSAGHEVVPLDVALQASPSGFLPYLESRGVRYLVLEHTVASSVRVAERLRAGCARLRLDTQVTATTLLFELTPAASTADSSAACAAIGTYQAAESHWPDQLW